MSESGFNVRLEKNTVKFTLYGVPDQPGMAAEIFDRLSQVGVNVELVVQTASGGLAADIALAVHQESVNKTHDELRNLKLEIQAEEIALVNDVALITLKKENLSRSAGVAARMFRTLANLGINIDLISTSLDSITCLITRDRADEANEALLREFHQ